MKKEEYLEGLRTALRAAKLPSSAIAEGVEFYTEAIDDRMEEGASEEEAVARMGSLEDARAAVSAEVPPVPRRIARLSTGSHALDIALAVIACPVWIPFALACIGILASVYLALWLVVAAVWMLLTVAFLTGAVGVFAAFWGVASGAPAMGLLGLGIGLAASGIALLAVPLAAWATSALVKLAERFGRWVAGLFMRGRKEAWGAREDSSDSSRLMTPSWPRQLLLIGLSVLGAGTLLALIVLASCGFDPASLPQLPQVNLFGAQLDIFTFRRDSMMVISR